MNKIPIIVVADPSKKVELPDVFVIAATVSPLDVLSRKGSIAPATEIAVIDLDHIDKRELVECGILLRNDGRTVVVCDTNRLPLDLIVELHKFSVETKRKGKRVRTELLFIEEAIEVVADLPELKKLD